MLGSWVLENFYSISLILMLILGAGSGMWCSEIISPIKENLKDYGVDLTDVADFAALTPYMLYKKLKYMPTILEVDED